MESTSAAASAIHVRRLRVPDVDWSRVVTGAKTELREAGARLRPEHLVFPQPVVAWTQAAPGLPVRHQLLTVRHCWTEPLGAISAESIEREGFATVDEFRAYWRQRHDSFRPLDRVVAYRFEPLLPDDYTVAAQAMFDTLFGEWL